MGNAWSSTRVLAGCRDGGGGGDRNFGDCDCYGASNGHGDGSGDFTAAKQPTLLMITVPLWVSCVVCV